MFATQVFLELISNSKGGFQLIQLPVNIESLIWLDGLVDIDSALFIHINRSRDPKGGWLTCDSDN
ncbi:hypothetical protein NIES4101_29270 [Calothrix sp. NIES-4101]|nr:hypothetical protein NIES4101_29270 [Calothrix sp. NIES-4101]